MSVSMKEAQKYLSEFKSVQREFGYKDSINVNNAKWDMREIVDDIFYRFESKDEKILSKLFRFFVMYSNDRSFHCFARQYHEYYDTMIHTIEDRKRRKEIFINTRKRISESQKEAGEGDS